MIEERMTNNICQISNNLIIKDIEVIVKTARIANIA